MSSNSLTNFLASPLSDHTLAERLRESPEALGATAEGENLIDAWIQALKSEDPSHLPPLVYAGQEVLDLLLERFGVSAWLLPSAVISGRTRLHCMLDVLDYRSSFGSRDYPPLSSSVVYRLADMLPGEHFTSWRQVDKNRGVSTVNAFALFERYRSDCHEWWLEKGWSARNLTLSQIEGGDFLLFQKAIADGWDPQRLVKTVDNKEPRWMVLVEKLKPGYSWSAKEKYLSSLRSWLQENGLGGALSDYDQHCYWKNLKSSTTVADINSAMVALPNWDKLKNEAGANPVLVSLNLFPHLLATTKWTNKAESLLHEVDSKGRDIWFYVLSAESRPLFPNGLVNDGKGKSRHNIVELFKAYPPQVDAKGLGWLEFLLNQEEDAVHKVVGQGSVTLLRIYKEVALPGVRGSLIESLQAVLQPGSVEQQRKLTKAVLSDTVGDREVVKKRLCILNRLFSLMTPETHAQVIPELRYLGCLGYLIATKETDAVRPPVDAPIKEELRDLALGGLQFGGVLKKANGKIPWSHPDPIPEWDTVAQLLVRFSQQSFLDVETGWRTAVLDAVPKMEDAEATEVPRL